MKIFNKTQLILLTLLLTFLSFSICAFAQDDDNVTSQQIAYEIYDKSGNLVSSGILPTSEKEAMARVNYPSQTLANGQTMRLKRLADNEPFNIMANQTINLKFALNRTVNMRVYFWDSLNNTYIGSIWEGITGGLSTSRTPAREGEVTIGLTNYSSDPVTVLWASVIF